MDLLQHLAISGFRVLMIMLSICTWAGATLAANPAFDCGKVAPGSIEELICKDDGLAPWTGYSPRSTGRR
jgi:hypothetical protein